ncbi:MAG TPA: hypothetical protein ENH96_03365 [Chlamydiae bacterium]|nr:hypothetical protein [Candidatus Anoxychlamydiales bacterium]HEU64411.1 hypothetical protein [Chlamydiota bacterium]
MKISYVHLEQELYQTKQELIATKQELAVTKQEFAAIKYEFISTQTLLKKSFERILLMQKEIEHLKEKLNKNSNNSSKPPST